MHALLRDFKLAVRGWIRTSVRTEARIGELPALTACILAPCWSGQQDLNLRHSGSKPETLTGLSYTPLFLVLAEGIEPVISGATIPRSPFELS